MTSGEVHADGVAYAAIVWRMSELFGLGPGLERLFGYVVGMNYTPSRPACGGILVSLPNGTTSGDCALVWQAFAQFGVGVGANGVGNADRAVTITEPFDEPLRCP